MKKIFFVLLCILTISGTSSAQTEFTGRWIISTYDVNLNDYAIELIFKNGIDSYSDREASDLFNTEKSRTLAAGLYTKNYNFRYHLLDEDIFYYNNLSNPLYTSWGSLANGVFFCEQDVILRPEHPSENFIVYSKGDTPNVGDRVLGIQRIFTDNLNVPAYGGALTGCLFHVRQSTLQNMIDPFSFAVAEEFDDERKLFTIANNFYINVNGGTSFPPGIMAFNINEDGVNLNNYDVIYQDASNDPFGIYDFAAYTMEIVPIDPANDEYWFIWTSEESSRSDRVFMTNADNIHRSYHINKGRIGGIEFFNNDPTQLYISTTDQGIVMLDLDDYPTFNLTQVSSVNDFNHTDLQKGPDGNIYAVSNDGKSLGQINKSNGTFYPNHLNLQKDGVDCIINTYRVFENPGIQGAFINYYKLPKNDRTYIPITAEADLTHVICPGDETGEAFVEVTAGDGYPFTFVW